MTKRTFDFLMSMIGILMLSPIFIIISIAIVVDSKGGVFYRQERIGRGRKPFKLLKFRSMKTGSDKKGLLTVGSKDSRVTKIGLFIRKYKLDELPQLINILLGDMSFVGPRPEVKKYVDLYTKEQLMVLSVKPGLTDYASLEYFAENELLAKSSDPEETYIKEIMPSKLNLNFKYIKSSNLQTDIKLILLTIKRIVTKP